MRITLPNRHEERGTILILVAIFLVVIIGALAFAVDINHLYVVRNELQNAADAGALAGAANLYNDDGAEINLGANRIAYDTALLNRSEKISVEVIFDTAAPDDNNHDVQRGHWSFNPPFGMDKFTPNDSPVVVPFWGVSEEELDADPNFINAVKVTARREDTPAINFFAQLLGIDSFPMSADAVAYIGFSGSLEPMEADQPIVICEEYLKDSEGDYECNIGRMLNSGNAAGESTINTAGWSNMTAFDDEESCKGTSATPQILPLICSGGSNADKIDGTTWLQANNGVKTPAFKKLRDSCEIPVPDDPDTTILNENGVHPLQMKLPVVNCSNVVGNCVEVTSAVVVNLLYMSEGNGEGTVNVETAFIPETMTDPENPETFRDWSFPGSCDGTTGSGNFVALAGMTRDAALDELNLFPYFDADTGVWQPYDGTITDRWNKVVDSGQGRWGSISDYTLRMAQWDCFVDHFGLKNDDETMAPLAQKSMYFMPDCSPHEGSGETGDINFGVPAKFPVLVE